MSRHHHQTARPAQAVLAVQEPVADAPVPVREKTLLELNREAWAIDAEHAERREAADRAVQEHVAPLLEGTIRGRQRMRRLQKPIAPPYRAPKAAVS